MPASTPPSPGPSKDQLTGRLLVGRYRLNRPVASGGMAQVWEATDETLARRVAVKLLHLHLARDDSFVRRFRAEAVAAARLGHPSIVSVYDTFSEDGLEAIVMELVVGTTMRAELDDHGPMRLEAVLAIGTQVADALGAAHAAGLVHRDVKPANILLSADGRVLVADFGIAKAAEGGDLTAAGAMVGTAKYLAPEQVEGGPIDGRADLYSLGIVLYEALTGVAPFVADTDTGTALARLHRDATPPSQLRGEIPSGVEAVVLHAMARSPHDRFASAAAMRAALLSAGADPRRAPAVAAAAAAQSPGPPRPAEASPSPPPPPPAQRFAPTPLATPQATPPRRRSRGWMLAVVLIALAGVAAFFAFRNPDDGASPTVPGEVPIVSARTFDPQGDNGTENDEQVANAIDDSAQTTWSTEPYRDPANLGKDGVGLVLTLDQTTDIGQVDVNTLEGGWSAQIYVASGDGLNDLAAWGEPVASVQDAPTGNTRLTIPGTNGNQVLVWFTQVSPSGTVAVADVTVRSQ